MGKQKLAECAASNNSRRVIERNESQAAVDFLSLLAKLIAAEHLRRHAAIANPPEQLLACRRSESPPLVE